MVWSSEALASPPRKSDHAILKILFSLFNYGIISFYEIFATFEFLLIKMESDIIKVSVQNIIIDCKEAKQVS